MSLLPAIEKRRAFRALDARPIDDDVLTELAQAAHLAPSCGNTQPWRFITAALGSELDAVKAALTSGNYWALKAPAITAVVTNHDWDKRQDHGRDYAFFDTGMAVANYLAQATHLGLYAHPIAGFDVVKVKAALGIPDEAILLTLIILGYPGDQSGLNERHLASETGPRVRKPLTEVYATGQWNQGLIPPQLA